MFGKPLCGQISCHLQRARFFKQVRGFGHDFQVLNPGDSRIRLLVEWDHLVIRTTHDEQDGRAHSAQSVAREIWTSTPRNNRTNIEIQRGRSDERRGGTGARAKITDAEGRRSLVLGCPMRGDSESRRQKWDIKAQMRSPVINALFLASEEIEEQRSQPCVAQDSRDLPISRTMPTAATAMREEYQAAGVGGNLKCTLKVDVGSSDFDIATPRGRRPN